VEIYINEKHKKKNWENLLSPKTYLIKYDEWVILKLKYEGIVIILGRKYWRLLLYYIMDGYDFLVIVLYDGFDYYSCFLFADNKH
jgi:hypothetical protein